MSYRHHSTILYCVSLKDESSETAGGAAGCGDRLSIRWQAVNQVAGCQSGCDNLSIRRRQVGKNEVTGCRSGGHRLDIRGPSRLSDQPCVELLNVPREQLLG